MMTPAEFKDYYNKDPEHAKLELATLQAKRYGKRKILILRLDFMKNIIRNYKILYQNLRLLQ